MINHLYLFFLWRGKAPTYFIQNNSILYVQSIAQGAKITHGVISSLLNILAQFISKSYRVNFIFYDHWLRCSKRYSADTNVPPKAKDNYRFYIL